MSKFLRIALLISVAAFGAGCSKDYTAYALTNGSIIQFSTNSPSTIDNTVSITGLNTNEYVVQLSYQPSSGTLYCITSDGYLCTVDPSSGVAALVGSSPFTLSGSTTVTLTNPVISFDPVGGDLRVISIGSSTAASGYNLLVNPDGALGSDNTAVSYASGQVSNGGTPQLVGLAYSNPVAGATSTTLYALDENTSSLVQVGNSDASSAVSADGGQVTIIGSLGLTLNESTAFTIDQASDTGYASLENGGPSTLYTVDLSSGALTELGTIGDGTQTITALVIVPGD